MARTTPGDLLTLIRDSSERQEITKRSFSFLKFIIFDDLEQKNEINGDHASCIQ